MTDAKLIVIEGYWHDERLRYNQANKFERRCLVMPSGLTDEQRDAVIEAHDDDSIFFVFEEGEAIVGRHLDFEVVFFNPL